MTGSAANTADQKRELLAKLLKEKQSKVVPTSFAQERLWLLDQIEPNNTHYNLAIAVELHGDLDTGALNEAFNEIVRRHETLRTTFITRNDEPVQVIHAPAKVKIHNFDLSGFDESEKDTETQRLISNANNQPFNLITGPLFRVSLICLDKKIHLLLMTIHHIVTDGWSNSILINELSELYRAGVASEQAVLPKLEIQYSDFAVWQKQRLNDGVFSTQLDYWVRQLENIAPLELPTDRLRPAVQTFNGALLHQTLSVELTRNIRALCQQHGVSLYMAMLACFNILLQRYASQDDVSVGSPIANRNRAEIESLIGIFVNSVVIRTDLSGDPEFLTLLNNVKENTLAAFEHQDIPFEKLVEELQPERNRSMPPLFQVMFTVQNTPARDFELTGLSFKIPQMAIKTVRFDLEVHVWEQSDVLTLGFIYNTDLFDADTIERMLAHYQKLLVQVTANPTCRIGDLELLTESEYQRVVVESNRTDLAFPSRAMTVHELFEAQVERTPAAVALEFYDKSLSYRELNLRANRLAHYLQDHGVGADSTVGICLPRGIEAVTTILAVLKAGGAYTPLDPDYPEERLGFMLQDSQCLALVTQSDMVQKLPSSEAFVICLDEDSSWSECSERNPDHQTLASNLAYVIFTSGSTGRPKGIAMPHSVLLNMVHWQLQRSGVSGCGRTLQFSSLSFDVSFEEIFSTWCAGGTLVLVDEILRRDPIQLLDFLDQARINRIFMPFAGLNQLCEVAQSTGCVPGSLREIITAGEALQVTPAMEYLFERLEDCTLDNQYGPSETHVATAGRLQGNAIEWPRLPSIGRPIANAKVYLLDDRMRPVPVGIPGELYIGGQCVADGYLGRPELTDEKFIRDPFSEVAGARMYRTGDLARYRADGNIDYMGRIDTQVKLRGYRIELAEIEAVLMEQDDVEVCVAMVREDRTGDRRLVAYYVGTGLSQDDIRNRMKKKLPEYMLPSIFVEVESLPLTPSGKIDRGSLPAPDGGRHTNVEFLEPRTELEQQLAKIWQELLNVDRIGVNDNFFDLGGHSLMATRVVSHIRRLLELDLPVSSLFDHATVAALAQYIETVQWVNESSAGGNIDSDEHRQVGEL